MRKTIFGFNSVVHPVYILLIFTILLSSHVVFALDTTEPIAKTGLNSEFGSYQNSIPLPLWVGEIPSVVTPNSITIKGITYIKPALRNVLVAPDGRIVAATDKNLIGTPAFPGNVYLEGSVPPQTSSVQPNTPSSFTHLNKNGVVSTVTILQDDKTTKIYSGDTTAAAAAAATPVIEVKRGTLMDSIRFILNIDKFKSDEFLASGVIGGEQVTIRGNDDNKGNKGNNGNYRFTVMPFNPKSELPTETFTVFNGGLAHLTERVQTTRVTVNKNELIATLKTIPVYDKDDPPKQVGTNTVGTKQILNPTDATVVTYTIKSTHAGSSDQLTTFHVGNMLKFSNLPASVTDNMDFDAAALQVDYKLTTGTYNGYDIVPQVGGDRVLHKNDMGTSDAVFQASNKKGGYVPLRKETSTSKSITGGKEKDTIITPFDSKGQPDTSKTERTSTYSATDTSIAPTTVHQKGDAVTITSPTYGQIEMKGTAFKTYRTFFDNKPNFAKVDIASYAASKLGSESTFSSGDFKSSDKKVTPSSDLGSATYSEDGELRQMVSFSTQSQNSGAPTTTTLQLPPRGQINYEGKAEKDGWRAQATDNDGYITGRAGVRDDGKFRAGVTYDVKNDIKSVVYSSTRNGASSSRTFTYSPLDDSYSLDGDSSTNIKDQLKTSSSHAFFSNVRFKNEKLEVFENTYGWRVAEDVPELAIKNDQIQKIQTENKKDLAGAKNEVELVKKAKPAADKKRAVRTGTNTASASSSSSSPGLSAAVHGFLNFIEPGETARNVFSFGVGTNTGYHQFMGLLFTSYQNRQALSNALFGDAFLNDWVSEVDQFFAQSYLGSDYWVSAICRKEFDVIGDGVAAIEGPGGTIQMVATIQGEHSEKVPMLCPMELTCEEGVCDALRNVCVDEEGQVISKSDEDTKPIVCVQERLDCPIGECRVKDNLCIENEKIVSQFFYKITYAVRAPQDEKSTPYADEAGAVSFNIVVSGPDQTVTLFEDFYQLKNGEPAKDAIVKYSPFRYDNVCLIFGKKPKGRTGKEVSRACNPIGVSSKSFDNFKNNPGAAGKPKVVKDW